MTKEYPTEEGYYIVSQRRNGRGYIGYLFKYYGEWEIDLDPIFGSCYFGNGEINWRSVYPINVFQEGFFTEKAKIK